ncbi:hypothetical protein PRIPAC_97655 [Pristionchus pacificus]|uniref:Uncharacterized protein n=1 Tax=Pristionchus pacificus TaxID=54126 RepID=A0A454Y066_PRIPA|nr:hypothetical protein PRIPAC_97655 [Pristionchus pacificus]|eukprot:PDM84835.1 hypothetical protein PRIPAC_33858 [Pristionchus pacificus]
MCREGASGSVVFLKIIDDSEEGEVLLEEWDRLTEQECLLEEKLLRLEQAVLEKYPDIKAAGIVIRAVLPKDDCTLLRRYAALIQMKKRAFQMIETVNREIASAQKETRRELDEVNDLLADIEAQLGT